MMPELQTFRQFPHRDRIAAGKSLDRQQPLVLLRRHARLLRRFLAETEKDTQGVTKCGQILVLRFRKFASGRHDHRFTPPSLAKLLWI